MIHDWFSAIELPLTKRQFRQLPQNPAYKYEYFDGRAWLSPRPKNYHAVLNLQEFVRPGSQRGDRRRACHPRRTRRRLAAVARIIFRCVPTRAALCKPDGRRSPGGGRRLLVLYARVRRRPAGRRSLPGCVARGGRHVGWGEPHYASAGRCHRARDRPAAPDMDLRRSARCTPGRRMALLEMAVPALRRLGYTGLASTFLLGNESSMLWHWRAGFKLLERR